MPVLTQESFHGNQWWMFECVNCDRHVAIEAFEPEMRPETGGPPDSLLGRVTCPNCGERNLVDEHPVAGA